MKTAIVRPNAGKEPYELQEPLGAEALCGCLRERGLDCRVFDFRTDSLTGKSSLIQLEEYCPDYIGFSLMTEEEAVEAAKILQMLRGKAEFGVGGLFVTTNPDTARALFPRNTRLFTGEGEADVLNWVTGQQNSRFAPDEWAEASRDDLEIYLGNGGVINIRSSGGCAGNCSFCATPQLPEGENRWRTRSIHLIADEISALSRRYAPVFNFTDDYFGPVSRIEELCTELKERKIRAAFSLETRPQDLISADGQAFRRIHEGGLCRLFCGLESVNPQTQKSWRKPVNPEAFFLAADRCRAAGIDLSAGYILWHRDCSEESVREETEELYRHGLFNVKTALSRLILFPGCERSGKDIRRAVPEPLTEKMENLYAEYQRELAPLMKLWTKAAVKLPGATCRDWLLHEKQAERIRCFLIRTDDACAEYVLHHRRLTGEKMQILEEECNEICAAGYGPG